MLAVRVKPVLTVNVSMCITVNPFRVLLLVNVREYDPPGVLAEVVIVRVDDPDPPEIVYELKVAPMPAVAVAGGIVIPSFTRLLKLAFGEIVTVTDRLPGGTAETGLGLLRT